MKSERKKTLGPWMLADQVCDRSSSCSCKVKCRMYELPRPWSSLLSATDETEFYRQLAPFTAFLEAITRLSPPRQPWVSTHWRTVKNLLSLSCIPQRGGATARISFWKLMGKCLKQGSYRWIQNLLSLNSPTQQCHNPQKHQYNWCKSRNTAQLKTRPQYQNSYLYLAVWYSLVFIK